MPRRGGSSRCTTSGGRASAPSGRPDAGVARLDQEGRDRPVELREDDRQLGDAAVRDVALLAVEDVLVAVTACRRLDSGDVGARARLGERDRREAALLRGEPRQPALLLLLGARAQQRPHGEHRRADRRRQAGAAPGELLPDQARGDRGDPAAAVLAGIACDVTRAPPPAEQLGRAVLPLVPLARDRPQLLLGEVVREVAQLRCSAESSKPIQQISDGWGRRLIARRPRKGAARRPRNRQKTNSSTPP